MSRHFLQPRQKKKLSKQEVEFKNVKKSHSQNCDHWCRWISGESLAYFSSHIQFLLLPLI